MDDELDFLKSGKQALSGFEDLDKATKKKQLKTLIQYSRNFSYEGNFIVLIENHF